MRIWLLSIGLIQFLNIAQGQNAIHYSQFHQNKTLYNPAAVGIGDKVNLTFLGRKQWASFPGSPQYNVFLGDISVNHDRMGLGIRLSQQSIVANKNWEAHLMYAYKINLRKGKMAFGVNAGAMQYQFVQSLVAVKEEDDILLASKQNQLYPDLAFGLAYSKNEFFIGFSALGLISHPKNSFNLESNRSFISKTFVLTIDKNWKLSNVWGLQTALLSHYALNERSVSSISLVTNYKKELFMGGNFKSNKSAAIILGLKLDKLSAALENVCLGYSYDLNFSPLSSYLNNTHEISINIKFDKPKSLNKEKQKPEEISPYDL